MKKIIRAIIEVKEGVFKSERELVQKIDALYLPFGAKVKGFNAVMSRERKRGKRERRRFEAGR